MKGAERVCEARMFRALIGIEAQAELLDASQSLKLARVDQTHHQLAFIGIGAKANDVVDRIAIDSFGHFGDFLIPAKEPKGNESRDRLIKNTKIIAAVAAAGARL